MSNWRISFGLGPLRYIRRVGGNKPASKAEQEPQQKKSALGVIITLVVVVGLVYLCCSGGVAWMNSQQS